MDSLVQTLLEVLEAFNRNDLALIAERVDPEVTYVIPGRAAVSGEFHGVEAVTAAFRRLRERSGNSISVELQTVLADEETVLFVARVTANHDGRHLDATNAYRYRFRSGRLIEGRLFPGDMAAIEAFFVGPPRPDDPDAFRQHADRTPAPLPARPRRLAGHSTCGSTKGSERTGSTRRDTRTVTLPPGVIVSP